MESNSMSSNSLDREAYHSTSPQRCSGTNVRGYQIYPLDIMSIVNAIASMFVAAWKQIVTKHKQVHGSSFCHVLSVC